MKPIIYLDVLIAVNLFINYFLLLATGKFLSLKLKKSRIIFGEILGGFFSLYILLPPLNIFFSLLIKFLMSASIVLASFKSTNLKSFFKTLICFYTINFAFSGIMFALWCMFKPNGMQMNNSTVYFNISPVVLAVSTTIAYVIIEIINRTLGRKLMMKSKCEVHINNNGNSVTVNAMVDTENSLKEPFSGLPVIVASESSVKNICPEEIVLYCSKNLEKKENQQLDLIGSKFRLIPFKTVSGEGILPAFKPESIFTNDKIPKQAYIAICKDSILPKDFPALISPDIAC